MKTQKKKIKKASIKKAKNGFVDLLEDILNNHQLKDWLDSKASDKTINKNTRNGLSAVRKLYDVNISESTELRELSLKAMNGDRTAALKYLDLLALKSRKEWNGK